MKIYNQPIELIVDVPSVEAKTKTTSLQEQLATAGLPIEKIISRSAKLPPQQGIQAKNMRAAPAEKRYVKTKITDTEMNPWDAAHGAAKAMGDSTYVEPDSYQEFTADKNVDIPFKSFGKGKKDGTTDADYDPDWMPHQNTVWHLGDAYSGLLSARNAVADIDYTIRIGHLDTGYNPTHIIVPQSAKDNKLQRNFVDGEPVDDAHDPYLKGALRMPGHGTGTIGILAGNRVQLITANGGFDDYLGGAPFAEIICCRIAPSVILMKTSAFAEALNYLTALSLSGTPVHAVSMSMGGAPAKVWADAVNAAYEAGITIVTAAGNNFNGLPTQHVIYPARFARVISACGVTNNMLPYHTLKRGEMQGCYGPEKDMSNALCAFTPNVPWASDNDSLIKFSGAGTSSATPQIAAAAALYYRKYNKELDALTERWRRVEAIRHALFSSASQEGMPWEDCTYKQCFGNGILQAAAALNVAPATDLPQTPKVKTPWFPILTSLFKALPDQKHSASMEMYNTELSQLVYQYPELREIINNDEKPYEAVSVRKWNRFRDAVIAHPAASTALKTHLMETGIKAKQKAVAAV